MADHPMNANQEFMGLRKELLQKRDVSGRVSELVGYYLKENEKIYKKCNDLLLYFEQFQKTRFYQSNPEIQTIAARLFVSINDTKRKLVESRHHIESEKDKLLDIQYYKNSIEEANTVLAKNTLSKVLSVPFHSESSEDASEEPSDAALLLEEMTSGAQADITEDLSDKIKELNNAISKKNTNLGLYEKITRTDKEKQELEKDRFLVQSIYEKFGESYVELHLALKNEEIQKSIDGIEEIKSIAKEVHIDFDLVIEEKEDKELYLALKNNFVNLFLNSIFSEDLDAGFETYKSIIQHSNPLFQFLKKKDEYISSLKHFNANQRLYSGFMTEIHELRKKYQKEIAQASDSKEKNKENIELYDLSVKKLDQLEEMLENINKKHALVRHLIKTNRNDEKLNNAISDLEKDIEQLEAISLVSSPKQRLYNNISLITEKLHERKDSMNQFLLKETRDLAKPIAGYMLSQVMPSFVTTPIEIAESFIQKRAKQCIESIIAKEESGVSGQMSKKIENAITSSLQEMIKIKEVIVNKRGPLFVSDLSKELSKQYEKFIDENVKFLKKEGLSGVAAKLILDHLRDELIQDVIFGNNLSSLSVAPKNKNWHESRADKVSSTTFNVLKVIGMAIVCLLVPPAAPWIIATATALDTESALRKVIGNEIKSNKHIASSIKTLEGIEEIRDRSFKKEHSTLPSLIVKDSEKSVLDKMNSSENNALETSSDSSLVSMPLKRPTKIETLKKVIKKHPFATAAVVGVSVILLPVLAAFKLTALLGIGVFWAGKEIAILTGIIGAHKVLAASVAASAAVGGIAAVEKNNKSSTASTIKGLKIDNPAAIVHNQSKSSVVTKEKESANEPIISDALHAKKAPEKTEQEKQPPRMVP